MWSDRLKRFGELYRTFAILLLTTLLLILVVLGALYAFVRFPSPTALGTKVIYDTYPPELIRAAYPGRTDAEVKQLLEEIWSRPSVFAPYTQFREAPFSGTYVNIAPEGFRIVSSQGSWPLSDEYYNVFVFGGSTAFGYGVADDETIGAYLQEVLGRRGGKEVRVYNFGSRNYYSTQERVLFEQLLVQGAVPDAAVFVDGLNDLTALTRNDEPANSEMLRSLTSLDPVTLISYALRIPFLKRALFPDTSEVFVDVAPQPAETHADLLITRYRANQRLIEAAGRVHGVTTVFAWQPVPWYGAGQEHNEFAQYRHLFGETTVRTGYPLIAEMQAKGTFAPYRFAWCADVGEELSGSGFVDFVHYSPEQARLVARCIARVFPGDIVLE